MPAVHDISHREFGAPTAQDQAHAGTFCFIVNRNGTSSDFPAVETEFFAAIKGIRSVIMRDLQ
jgi:hypothetical protein